jgi:diguanylate cyclase (GGDEF)-like protein/PAS domain S-box-containing protein
MGTQPLDQHEPALSPSSPGLALHVLTKMPGLVAYLDASRRYIYANDSYRQWMVAEPERMIGRTVVETIGEETYAVIRTDMDAAFDGTEARYERELRIGGELRYVRGSYTPDIDSHGNVRGVIVLVVDITERRQLETDLRESQLRFIGAFEHAAIGMALVQPDGRWMQVNRVLCEMFGYNNAQLLATTFQQITHPDDLAADLQLLSELVAGNIATYQMEKRYFHREGHVVHALLSVSLVRDPAGTPMYFVSQIQDISERKAAEAALFRERELAQVTLKSIGDAVITTDLDLIITSLNPIAEGMTGWTHEAAAGRPMDEVFCLRDIATGQRAPNPLRQAIEQNVIVGLASDTALIHLNGFDSPIEDSAAPIHDHAGRVIGGVVVFHDVSETRALAMKMAHLANHDTLTGLPNRNVLQSRMESALAEAVARRSHLAVLFIDIDHFKQVNDVLGHKAGDRLLKAVARRIRDELGDNDMVCRLGGDEFVVMLPHIEYKQAVAVAERLLDRCRDALPMEASDLAVNFSIGISIGPEDARDAETLIHNADTAMYEAKQQGRNGYRQFNPAMHHRGSANAAIEIALRQAIVRDELKVHYQPKIDVRTGWIVGAEALLRWIVNGEEVYTPDEFVPVAEEAGLIVTIGEWVLRRACEQAQKWRAVYKRVPISVNVSAVQFQQTRFFETLQSVLEDTGLAPAMLELELTERMVMSGHGHVPALLQKIKALGVKLSLDDFGTGYSSLSYLKHFPIDTLKIDRAFVRDIDGATHGTNITGAIIALAQSLGKEVVAEGVETTEQAEYLLAAGCPVMQGFLYGMPMPASDFAHLLAAADDHEADFY